MAIPPELQNLTTPLDYVGVIPGHMENDPNYDTRSFVFNIVNSIGSTIGNLSYDGLIYFYTGQIGGAQLGGYHTQLGLESEIPDETRVLNELYNFFESPEGQDFIATNYP